MTPSLFRYQWRASHVHPGESVEIGENIMGMILTITLINRVFSPISTKLYELDPPLTASILTSLLVGNSFVYLSPPPLTQVGSITP